MDPADDIIDDAAIQQVMHDVGLTPSDLINEADGVEDSKDSSMASADDDSEEESKVEEDESGECGLSDGELVIAGECVVLGTLSSLGLKDGPLEESKLTCEEDHQEEKTGNSSISSVAIRRSNRTKQSNDTPSPSAGRTTRSQNNPDIIAKQKSFMQKYQIAVKSSMDSYVRSAANQEVKSEQQQAVKRKWEDSGGAETGKSPVSSPAVVEKKMKKSTTNNTGASANKEQHKVGSHFMESDHKEVMRHDNFCWACHLDGQVLECRQCPRSFHQRCVQLQSPIPPKWLCTECCSVRNAEKHYRVSHEQLASMLGFAMERIKSVADAQPFFKPVDTEQFPHYLEYIVNPVDIGQLEEKIAQKAYASTRAFLADFRWILHNCIIFNSFHSKLTNTARTLMKVCKHEMAEIDTCADCYLHAHTKRETWFLEPCRRPHLLLWAKLKGFPHWPAKAMKSTKEGNVDVRFFGAHDRAWVPAKDCYLYSREMPMQLKNQRKANLASSIEEVDQHIKKLVERFGSFAYPPVRTAYNPQKDDEQLNMLIPGFKVVEESMRSRTDQGGDQVEIVSENSDSEDTGESVENETSQQTTPAPTTTEATPSEPPVLQEPENSDRTEDRNFLAMLQLAPVDSAATPVASASRSAAPSPTLAPNVTPSNETKQPAVAPSNSKPQVKSGKLTAIANTKTVTDENTVGNKTLVSGGVGKSYEVVADVLKPKKVYLATPVRRSSISKETAVPIKVEPTDDEEIESGTIPPSKEPPISLSIDKVVGNYKLTSTVPKPKADMPAKVTLKPAVKPVNVKTTAGIKPTVVAKTIQRPIPNKAGLNRPSLAKVPATKILTKPSTAVIRRTVGDEEEDLDPAMYLDPTITITLINNESENRRGTPKSVGEISSSDLQALNALGENVSITVVPKKKNVTPNPGRFKENEAIDQPMVIEVDPMALQKARAPQQIAKARKSFPKSRPTGQTQPQPQRSSQKATVAPMVTIPSRHLGMEISRPSNQISHSSSSARVPSITVRPVSHLPPNQPSIILQPGSSSDVAAANKQTNSSQNATGGGNSNTLTLNTMHALGPDSAFGTGGLLLTFNRSPVTAISAGSGGTSSATSASNKAEGGPLSAQLAARAQQISDMMRNTLESLVQDLHLGGNLEATVLQLQLELEKTRSQHQQEVDEMKKALESQQASADAEKQKALNDLKRQLEAEKQRAIDEVKKKQWCAQCGQEAIFYCCWNTAYCDYPCQQTHWPKHMATCANANQNTESEMADADVSSDNADGSNKTPVKTTATATTTVNGSPGSNEVKKNSSAASKSDSTSSSPGPRIPSPEVSVSLASTPSNSVALRVGQSVTGIPSVTQSAAPILIVSTPVRSSSDTNQVVSDSPDAVLPDVQGIKSLQASDTGDEAS